MQYNLEQNTLDGFVYWEVRKAIYGLPQAGKLANDQLRKNMAPAGYYEVAHTPGLPRHRRRPIQFTLIVDDFRVKSVGKKHVDHLLRALQKPCKTNRRLDW